MTFISPGSINSPIKNTLSSNTPLESPVHFSPSARLHVSRVASAESPAGGRCPTWNMCRSSCASWSSAESASAASVSVTWSSGGGGVLQRCAGEWWRSSAPYSSDTRPHSWVTCSVATRPVRSTGSLLCVLCGYLRDSRDASQPGCIYSACVCPPEENWKTAVDGRPGKDETALLWTVWEVNRGRCHLHAKIWLSLI